MLIQVLGTGCAKCNKLATLVEGIAKKEGIDFTLEKVTDINKIMDSGVMVTPALLVDGKLKCSGSIPGAEQVAAYLKQ